MPLKCLRDGSELYTFAAIRQDDWKVICEENRRQRNQKIACCGKNVVSRINRLGTRHFAHARRGQCSTAPEHAEHLLAKSIIVKAIRHARLAAKSEYRSQLESKQTWIGNVLARRDGKKLVTFEVQ
jgi:competence CoiA-like predicted nuclease